MIKAGQIVNWTDCDGTSHIGIVTKMKVESFDHRPHYYIRFAGMTWNPKCHDEGWLYDNQFEVL